MLTPQQIDELFAFCRRHYVHYYDVQLELVDHLANAVEEKMTSDKNSSFEAALNTVYNNFGYKGFAGVVEAKEKAVGKQWKRLRWNYFKSYFAWPKAALTLMLFAITIFIQNVFSYEIQKWFLILIPAFFLLYEVFISFQSYRKYKEAKDELLIVRYGFIFPVASIMYFNILLNFYQYSFKHWFIKNDTFTTYTFYQLSFIFILLFLFSLAYKATVEKILQQAKIQYPKAFAS